MKNTANKTVRKRYIAGGDRKHTGKKHPEPDKTSELPVKKADVEDLLGAVATLEMSNREKLLRKIKVKPDGRLMKGFYNRREGDWPAQDFANDLGAYEAFFGESSVDKDTAAPLLGWPSRHSRKSSKRRRK